MSENLGGGVAEAASTSEGSVASPAENAGGGAVDYIERVRTDPDFAEREVRNLKSRSDKADHMLEKIGMALGPAKPLIESGQIGGEKLLQGYQAWETVTQDPGMSKIITEYATTGQVPSLAGTTPHRNSGGTNTTMNENDSGVLDEYATETEIRLAAEAQALKAANAELKQRFDRLEQRFGQTESSFSMSSLQTNMASVDQAIGLPPEVLERIRGPVGEEVQALANRARNGDTVAQQNLSLLTGPEGAQQLERIVRSKLSNDDMAEIVKFNQLRKQKGLSRMDTGGPGLSGGEEQAIDASAFKGDWKSAIAAYRQNPDANPYS